MMEQRVFAYTHSSEVVQLSHDRYRIQILRHHWEGQTEVVEPHSFVYGESEPEVWEIARRKVRELGKTIPMPKPSWE